MAASLSSDTSTLEQRLVRLLGFTEARLTAWALDGSLAVALRSTFAFDDETIEGILSIWSSSAVEAEDQEQRLPEVRILEESAMGGAVGAYAADLDLIVLSQTFLQTATDEEVFRVLLEEYGHALDHHYNPVDTPGDEGDRFAAALLSSGIPSGEVTAVAQFDASTLENDAVTILVDGIAYTAEAAERVLGTPGNNILTSSTSSKAALLDQDTLRGFFGDDTYIGNYFDILKEVAGEGIDTLEYRNYLQYVQSAYFMPSEIEIAIARYQTVESVAQLNEQDANDRNFQTARRAIIVGNDLQNTIVGSELSDVLVTDVPGTPVTSTSASPRDVLRGGKGDDEYQVVNSNPIIEERPGEGADRVFYLGGYRTADGGPLLYNYIIPVNVEEAYADPFGADPISLFGNSQNNQIYGNLARNTLSGGAADDLLVGSPGGVYSAADFYIPGTGNDTVLYVSATFKTPRVLGSATAPALFTASFSTFATTEDTPSLSSFSTLSSTRLVSSSTAGVANLNTLGGSSPNVSRVNNNGSIEIPEAFGELDLIEGFEPGDMIDMEFYLRAWTDPDSPYYDYRDAQGPLGISFCYTTEDDYGESLPLGSSCTLIFNLDSSVLGVYFNNDHPFGSDLNPFVPIARVLGVGLQGGNYAPAAFNIDFSTTITQLSTATPTPLNSAPYILREQQFFEVSVQEDVAPTASGVFIADDREDGAADLDWAIVIEPGVPEVLNDDGNVIFPAVPAELDDHGLVDIVTEDGTVYGSFQLNLDGSWMVNLENESAAVQRLAEGDVITQTFTLQVRDSNGGTSEADFTVHVIGTNDAPVGTYTEYLEVIEDGEEISGQLTFRDVDGSSVVYALEGEPIAGLTINSDGSWSFNPSDEAYQDLAAGESFVIEVPYTVTDEQGATGRASFTIAVTGTNDAPVSTAEVIANGRSPLTSGKLQQGSLIISDALMEMGRNTDYTLTFRTDFTDLGALPQEVSVFLTIDGDLYAAVLPDARNLSGGALNTEWVYDSTSRISSQTLTPERIYGVASGGPTSGTGTTGGPNRGFRTQPITLREDTLADRLAASALVAGEPWLITYEDGVPGRNQGRFWEVVLTGSSPSISSLVIDASDPLENVNTNLLIRSLSEPNLLTGNAGDDSIVGGRDDDVIIGGLGSDTLTGGAGDDAFVYRQGEGSFGDTDTLIDFSEGDRIEVRAAAGFDVTSALFVHQGDNLWTLAADFTSLVDNTITSQSYSLHLANGFSLAGQAPVFT